MLKTLIKQIGIYKKASLLTIFFTVFEAFFEILIPYIMSRIIDEGVALVNISSVIKYGLIMILCAGTALLLGILSGKNGAYASSGFAYNLRNSMYENIQKFSFSNIDKYQSGGLITRMTTDVANLQNAFQMILRLMMRAPATLIFAIVMTVIISPKMSLIFLAAILFLGSAFAIIIMKATKIFNQVFEKYDELNSNIQENISGIRVVKSFTREEFEIKKFDKAVNNLYRLFVKAENIVCITNPIMLSTIYICILAISWFGAKNIVIGELSTGQLTSLFAYSMNVLISLMLLSFVSVMIIISYASAKRISEILNEKADIIDCVDGKREVKNGDIEFKNVSFSYKSGKGKDVLSDINIKIKSGETIGILGATGSSKTSFVSLIPRLYDVKSGSVKVGGVDVREYNLKALRDKVSMVLQKNEVFTGSILDNLRWGDEKADLEKCKTACKIACADEFIEKLELGYNTLLERGGSNISGGQKQRICIARALLKEPKIIIFDDSTSAIDNSTEQKIRKSLKEYMPDTTKIIISQRISGIKDADRIIVLHEGKVLDFDTHDNLLKNNEIYKFVAKAQNENNPDFDRKEE